MFLVMSVCPRGGYLSHDAGGGRGRKRYLLTMGRSRQEGIPHSSSRSVFFVRCNVYVYIDFNTQV